MKAKFRLWDNTTGKYFEPTYDASNLKLEYIVMGQSGDLDMVTMDGIAHESTFKDRFIIERFTGLQDKNGKDIYEGHEINGGQKGENVVVQWDDKCGRWIAYGETYRVLGHRFDRFEITGNIHNK